MSPNMMVVAASAGPAGSYPHRALAPVIAIYAWVVVRICELYAALLARMFMRVAQL
jgi:hypothetical protein